MTLSCTDCDSPLSWSGRGRKPRRCKECARKANSRQTAQRVVRDRAHRRGQSASRWGELWLVNGRPIRRESRYVWGATGERDESVTSAGGVFHPAGKDGLPDTGFTTSDKSLQTYLIAMDKEARRSKWLKDHPDWWRFEPFAHEAFTRDVTDSAVVHAWSLVDRPDERTPGERCTWCGDCKPLVLAGEFCGDACMTDYVTTFGPDGINLEDSG